MKDGFKRVLARATNAGYLLRLWNVHCSPDRSAKASEVVLCLRDPLVLHAAESALLVPGYVDSRPKDWYRYARALLFRACSRTECGGEPLEAAAMSRKP